MNCGCVISEVDDFAITFVQGDYASFLFELTDQNDDPLTDVENVVFSSKQLKLSKTLTKVSDTTYALTFESAETAAMTPVKCTYDLTVEFSTNASPVTLVYKARLIVLKKENAIDE